MTRKKIAKKPSYFSVVRSSKAADQPATRKMLGLVRNELKSEIRSVGRRVDGLLARFDGIDAKFDRVDARFESLEAKFDSKFDLIIAQLTRMELRLEEQTSNNRIALEAVQALWQRQDRTDQRLDAAGIL